jgi:hypothetical protein
MSKKEFTYKTNEGTTTVSSPDYSTYNQLVVPTNTANSYTIKTHHPDHYNKGIECWDYIVSHNMGFLEGNIIKYITRYKLKNGRADLLKAKEYLDKLLEEVK